MPTEAPAGCAQLPASAEAFGHRRSEGIGVPVRRREDARLLTGQGCFSDDLNLPEQVYAAFLRSAHAHARLLAIDVREARNVPGFLAAFTGEDLIESGVRPIPHLGRLPLSPPDIPLKNSDGSPFQITPHWPLAVEKVRFVGEAVAMVVAKTPDAAKDAAERLRVRYEILPAVTAATEAVASGAPLVWEEAGTNVCIDAEIGDRVRTDAAFRRAAHVVRLRTTIQRVTGVPMEPRSALGSYDPAARRYTLNAGSSGAVRHKHELAHVLAEPLDAIRVVCRDVGGNFGTRNALYPEFVAVLWAAKRLGRPVKWTCERQEAFLGDYQGRDLAANAELALDRHGHFLGLRASLISNLGANTVSFISIFKAPGLLTSVYQIPAAHVRARAALTNTAPTHPYRSTGRPEAMFILERLIDLAAHEHEFDPVDLRRRNLVREAEMPFANPFGHVYDSGDYPSAMDHALQLANWSGFPERRQAARALGRLRGIGLANYIEVTSGAPREYAKVFVRAHGCVEVVIGTQSSGQGHETSFAQLISEWLGAPISTVRLITGDTDAVPWGGGSHSGRSMRLAGIVIGKAVEQIIGEGRLIATSLLEAAESDIDFSAGRFTVRGTDRSIGLFDVAAQAEAGKDGTLSGECDETVLTPGFPYGCHVCEVEIDRETGTVEIAAYTAVDDVGRAINPLILHGQTHGGATQGIGQALWERCFYDSGSGELLSASMMDYALPRASDVPFFCAELSEVPSPTNPLGVRAGGEGGTTPALAAVINAIVNALSEFGVQHVEMPATPEQVWRAIEGALRCGERPGPADPIVRQERLRESFQETK